MDSSPASSSQLAPLGSSNRDRNASARTDPLAASLQTCASCLGLPEFQDRSQWCKQCRSRKTPRINARAPALRRLQIDLRTTQDEQMYSRFLNTVSQDGRVLTFGYAFITDILPEIGASTVLSNAAGAVSYGFLGTHHNDERLVYNSRRSYGRALASLQHVLPYSLEKSRKGLDRQVLLAMLLINIAECVALQGNRSEMLHAWAAHHYLSTCGLSRLDPNSTSDLKLVTHIMGCTVWLGISRRKAIAPAVIRQIVTNPAFRHWRGMAGNLARHDLAVECRTPGMLEDVDALVARVEGMATDPAFGEDAEKLCKRLNDHRNDYKAWLNNAFALPPVEVVHATGPDVFNQDIEEHCIMSCSTTFTTFRRPGSANTVQPHFSIMVLSLIVDCTVLRLLHFCPRLTRHLGLGVKIQTQALDLARRICEAAYYTCQFRSLAFAFWLRLTLSLLQNFFREVGAEAELEWTTACLIATKKRIKRLRRIMPATVCPVGALSNTFAAAGKFKANPREIIDTTPSDEEDEAEEIPLMQGRCPILPSANSPRSGDLTWRYTASTQPLMFHGAESRGTTPHDSNSDTFTGTELTTVGG